MRFPVNKSFSQRIPLLRGLRAGCIGSVLMISIAARAQMALVPILPDEAEHQGPVSWVDVTSRRLVINGQHYFFDADTRFMNLVDGEFAVHYGLFPADSLMGRQIAVEASEEGYLRVVRILDGIAQ